MSTVSFALGFSANIEESTLGTMELWQTVVIGIVQGLTEFLPISSTTHVKIVPVVLGWGDPGVTFIAIFN